MKDLGLVANVAACCMMTVLMIGSWYDAAMPTKVERVPCSVTLKHMASNFYVTLLDECEITR